MAWSTQTLLSSYTVSPSGTDLPLATSLDAITMGNNLVYVGLPSGYKPSFQSPLARFSKTLSAGLKLSFAFRSAAPSAAPSALRLCNLEPLSPRLSLETMSIYIYIFICLQGSSLLRHSEPLLIRTKSNMYISAFRAYPFFGGPSLSRSGRNRVYLPSGKKPIFGCLSLSRSEQYQTYTVREKTPSSAV